MLGSRVATLVSEVTLTANIDKFITDEFLKKEGVDWKVVKLPSDDSYGGNGPRTQRFEIGSLITDLENPETDQVANLAEIDDVSGIAEIFHAWKSPSLTFKARGTLPR